MISVVRVKATRSAEWLHARRFETVSVAAFAVEEPHSKDSAGAVGSSVAVDPPNEHVFPTPEAAWTSVWPVVASSQTASAMSAAVRDDPPALSAISLTTEAATAEA